MMEFIKKIFAKWFTEEEVLVLTEEIEEHVKEVELPTHCAEHSRFKKSCPLCRAFIA